MEMDRLDRHGMDLGLGLGEEAEDGDRLPGSAGRERRSLDAGHQFPEAAAMRRGTVVMGVVGVRVAEAEAKAAQPAAHAVFQ